MTINSIPLLCEKEANDCTIRAMCAVTNIDYSVVHSIFRKHGREHRCGFVFHKGIHKIAKDLGVKFKQILGRDSALKLIMKYHTGKFYCMAYTHAFPVIDGKILDGTSEIRQLDQVYELVEADE